MRRRKLCPHCGREVLKNAAFCPYCGFDLTKTVCEECLKKVDLSVDACPYCGAILRKEVMVPIVLNELKDERYRIVEIKNAYTILKENDITLEKFKPVTLMDFFYTSQGLYYDSIVTQDDKLPVLSPTHPVSTLLEYWSMLREDEKMNLVFGVSNMLLKHSKLYFARDPILFDADGRLIARVNEMEKEGYFTSVAWFKEFLRTLDVDTHSVFYDFLHSKEFNAIESMTELINGLYTLFAKYFVVDINTFALTSQGLVRGHNEDNYVAVEYVKRSFNGTAPRNLQAGLYIVSDGMGGHRGGEEASKLIVKVLNEEVFSYITKEHVFFDLAPVINRAIARANSVVYQKNVGASTEREKMGATLAGVLVIKDEMWYFNLGDSSIMLYDGKSLLKISVDDVMFSNNKVLTQAVGVVPFDKLVPHVAKYKVDGTIKFLICSDGLTDLVKFSEIEDVMTEDVPERGAKKLLSMALDRGGIDNITIVYGEIRRNKLF